MRRELLVWLALLVTAPPVLAPEPVHPPAAFSAAARAWASKYKISTTLAGSIIREAEQHGIPRDVAFRLVRMESAFDQWALGKAGEIGLTQLMPATARRVSPGTPISLVWLSDVNLHIGFTYLHSMRERYHNWCLAATAYNSGPHRRAVLRAQLAMPNAYAKRVLPRRLTNCRR